MRVGGPYSVTVAYTGTGTAAFAPETVENVEINLGVGTDLTIDVKPIAVTETVTVTAEASSVFTPSRVGTAENVSQAAIENLPTISRSLTDFARTSPFFVQTEINANQDSRLSVAGRNTRYNNIQIDGAVNNDLFGTRRASGTPGGPAETQPISLDAIQELQLVVAPYDVRQGSFSGGGINAITRSGTNSFTGSAFYYFRDQSLVGDGIDDRPIATFNDKQFGGTLGGPIVRRTRRSSSATSSGAARTRRPASRSPAPRACRSAARRRRSASSTSCSGATATTRRTLDEFIRGTQKRQGVRPRRLQPRAQHS